VAIAKAVADALGLAEAGFKFFTLEARVKRLEDALAEAQETIDSMEVSAQRWKGGFAALVALGAIAGWLLSVWGSIVKAIKP
jgi:hypothetical protein